MDGMIDEGGACWWMVGGGTHATLIPAHHSRTSLLRLPCWLSGLRQGRQPATANSKAEWNFFGWEISKEHGSSVLLADSIPVAVPSSAPPSLQLHSIGLDSSPLPRPRPWMIGSPPAAGHAPSENWRGTWCSGAGAAPTSAPACWRAPPPPGCSSTARAAATPRSPSPPTCCCCSSPCSSSGPRPRASSTGRRPPSRRCASRSGPWTRRQPCCAPPSTPSAPASMTSPRAGTRSSSAGSSSACGPSRSSAASPTSPPSATRVSWLFLRSRHCTRNTKNASTRT
ncbi:hypothetical protein PAHAL_3G150800 [Panicum hallii]|uniref:Uncharacterized protein n=1 Tax=Panicum hallii TaxID=206008 RepID=A0A2T8KI95_9POAL|nr:hypothetical protein PAHAL_3G150800 [Panicum hallii]